MGKVAYGILREARKQKHSGPSGSRPYCRYPFLVYRRIQWHIFHRPGSGDSGKIHASRICRYPPATADHSDLQAITSFQGFDLIQNQMTGRSIYRSMIESLQFIKGDFVVPQSFQYNFKVQIFFITGCHFQLPVSGYHHQRRYPLTCPIKRCIAIDNRNIERDIPFLPNRKMSIRLTTYREKSGQTIGIFPVPCQIGFYPTPPSG